MAPRKTAEEESMRVTPKVEAEPGLGIVADAFAANVQQHGEVSAAFCLYQDGRAVAPGWGGLVDPDAGRAGEAGHAGTGVLGHEACVLTRQRRRGRSAGSYVCGVCLVLPKPGGCPGEQVGLVLWPAQQVALVVVEHQLAG
jgi:hypothetical protein